MFTVEARDRVRDAILAMARSDSRVVAGAVIGSLTLGRGDRWSDLDLGFGLAPGASPAELLDDWTRWLEQEFQAIHLFDLPSLSTIYRVFLFLGCLQVDVSVTPGSEFAARGPKFKVLFGRAVERPYTAGPAPRDLFGLGVHHAVRARFCVARATSGRHSTGSRRCVMRRSHWRAGAWGSKRVRGAVTTNCRRRS